MTSKLYLVPTSIESASRKIKITLPLSPIPQHLVYVTPLEPRAATQSEKSDHSQESSKRIYQINTEYYRINYLT